MYAPPPYYSEDIDIACDLVKTIVMGTLVTSGTFLQGSPLPFMFEKGRDSALKLISHMDRRNPLQREMEDGREVLVIFWGPNAYISPSDYVATPRVPTWVYATVHMNGIPRLIHGKNEIDKIVSDLSYFMEKPNSGWDISQVVDYKEKLLDSIVGFEIDITSAQSQIRLGQQNDKEDIMAVYNSLSNGSHGEKQVAALMKHQGMLD